MVVKYIVFYALAAANYLCAEASLRATAVNGNAEKGSTEDRHF
jgi:hypothetical protein